MRIMQWVGLAAAAIGLMASGASAATLDDVKARGELVCGVNEGLLGFSIRDVPGWVGFDADFCRAVAAAIFGDPKKVRFEPLSVGDRFKALQDGKVDLLSRNTTWTMEREAALGLTFVGVTYYDGQGFMLPRASCRRWNSTSASSAFRRARRRKPTSPTFLPRTT